LRDHVGQVTNPAFGVFYKVEWHGIEQIALKHDDSFPGFSWLFLAFASQSAANGNSP
jgi:hypothetical protein